MGLEAFQEIQMALLEVWKPSRRFESLSWRFGRPTKGLGRVGYPSRMSGTGREALPKFGTGWEAL